MTHIFRRVTNITFALLLAVLSVNLSGVLSLQNAQAKPNPNVTICHATNSQSNPYTENTIDTASIDNSGNQYLNGHGDHTGPVWHQGIADHSWGDIIPPFTNDAGNSYPGYNWTTEGQAIYNNGCAPVTLTSVSPTAPTSVNPCGIANDTYTIPTTPGVDYQINGQTVAANTYPGTGSVTVTAVAQAGYVLQGTATWTFTFTNADCPVTATPPTKIDLCGTTNDTYTIPTTPGVTYKVNGVTKSAGTYDVTALQYIFGVTITAHATSGNVLQGTSSWTFTYSAQPCSVTPADPTKDDVCGKSNDTYTIPSTVHVKYYVNGVYKAAGTYSAPSAVLIVAVADPGYFIPFGTKGVWLFVFTNTTCPVSVTPTAPTQADVCGTANDTYTIPATTGVIYKVNGVVTPAGTYPATSSVTVTAEAALGYTLSGINSWTFDFTNVDCPVVPCTPTMVSALVLSQLTNSNNCPPGMGGGGTPSVVTTTTTYPTELPQTGPEASSTFAKLFMVATAGIVTYGVMFFLVNRRDLAKK